MTDTATVGRGRLTPERTREVYDAVLTLVVEHGYEGLTMDAIAHAASISKATLYRQWGGKETLVVDALESTHPRADMEAIDTGSLRGDLHASIRLTLQRPGKDVALVHAIMHACMTNDELARAMRERINDPDNDPIGRLFIRAAERGEIDGDSPALRYIPLIVAGSYILREFFEECPPDEEYLLGLIDSIVLPALGIH
ncbi:MAG: TetR/AcrR family transcriptional regulator [Actinomycetia bacterium]|nr:TetR/AcrR family transcriptional regulator [Actinomycetes bacterium]